MKRGGEPPGPEGGGGRAVTEDEGDADTTGQLRAMRSVWLSMRDEDPPDGGLVDLLAAARAKAATMQARPTLRQRLAAWARRPPALAVATMVVLVGGAALVLGRNSGHRASELAAGSSGAISDRGPQAETIVRDPAPQAETVVRDRGVDPVPQAEARPDRTHAEPPAAPSVKMRIAPSRPVTRGDMGGAEPMETTSRDDVAARHASTIDQGVAEQEYRTELEALYARCSSAAQRGDCAAVRTMVGKIAKTDRGYRARVAKDAAVARCLARTAADASAE